jgi:deoxyhypusine synthase
VTSAGGIEEDLMKCLAPFYIGDFNSNDKENRQKALNRIGNILVPNENYCKLEDWIMPIFKEMYEDQKKNNNIWSPSKMIRKFGEKINNKESVYYWCWKNNIPVFCPALTDGAIGDMMFTFSYKCEDFVCDII